MDSKNLIEKTKTFENSNLKPLLLLNSSQLARVIFFHRKELRKIRRKRLIEEKTRKNLKIIEDVNKRYGVLSHDVKRDTGFGRYRPLKEAEPQPGENVNFFMTNVDEEKKKKMM